MSDVSTNDSQTLRSCPFCGGEARLVSDYSSEHDQTRWNLWHECDGFDGESNGYSPLRPWFETPWYEDRDTAIAAWNRRADHD